MVLCPSPLTLICWSSSKNHWKGRPLEALKNKKKRRQSHEAESDHSNRSVTSLLPSPLPYDMKVGVSTGVSVWAPTWQGHRWPLSVWTKFSGSCRLRSGTDISRKSQSHLRQSLFSQKIISGEEQKMTSKSFIKKHEMQSQNDSTVSREFTSQLIDLGPTPGYPHMVPQACPEWFLNSEPGIKPWVLP